MGGKNNINFAIYMRGEIFNLMVEKGASRGKDGKRQRD
jgi:hypothetical protein